MDFMFISAGLSKSGCLVCDDLVRTEGGCTNRQVCQDTQVRKIQEQQFIDKTFICGYDTYNTSIHFSLVC